MDERIRQGYHKIYSELYLIIFVLAATSVIVNVTFFNKNITQMWLEYIILVGSPIYRLARISMLGIADSPAAGWNKVFAVRLFTAVALFVVIGCITVYFRDEMMDIRMILRFSIPFVVLFLLVAVGTKKLQESWKRQQEKKYEDENGI